MKISRSFVLLSLCTVIAPVLRAQDPVGAIDGMVADKSGRPLAAHVSATNVDTSFRKEAEAEVNGLFRIPLLPVGRYRLTVEAPQFATLIQEPIIVNVGQTLRVQLSLEVATVKETVTVTSDAPLVDTSTNTLGGVVTGHEILELPLNGRNFTQLGLLQSGAAPLTAGLIQAGGPMRQGQTYAVNGARPEQNTYVVDGAKNVNRMDSGYALQLPVDAIAEFRILTATAPPEYGGTAGATTAVITRSGTNGLHGDLYEFIRNDDLDTRNFFSTSVEPLHQNQFGGTLGGPVKRDKLFFFVYYEGYRNRQGETTSSIVPGVQERTGDFSGLGYPLLNFAAGGTQFPGNKISPQALNPIALKVVNLYPIPNAGPTCTAQPSLARKTMTRPARESITICR